MIWVEPITFFLYTQHIMEKPPIRNKPTVENIPGLVGESHYMKELRREINRIATGEFPVFIYGEPSTGKDIIASAIHAIGPRRSRDMICTNCAAIPPHLEDEEFLGHPHGASGGAWPAKMGLLACANHSTLFLNEINAMSSAMQCKLAQILGSGYFSPSWSRDERVADIRVISASTIDLASSNPSSGFSADLLSCLSGAVVKTIPLHEHREDIPDLIDHFITIKDDPKIPRKISPMALEMLVEHSWPGNLRELQYTVEVICITSMGQKTISEKAVQSVLKINEPASSPQLSYQEAKAAMIHDFEVKYFTKLIHHFKGNINQAAITAGMYRPNLLNKLKQLSIDPNAFRRKSHKNLD